MVTFVVIDKIKKKKKKKISVIKVLLRNSDNLKNENRLTISKKKLFWYGQETKFISCYDWP